MDWTEERECGSVAVKASMRIVASMNIKLNCR
jgi:hypothetical protein